MVCCAMVQGEGELRYCDVCDLHVHNISLMTRDRAEAVLDAREGRMPRER